MAEHKNGEVMKKIAKAAPGVGINEKVMKKIEKASKGSLDGASINPQINR